MHAAGILRRCLSCVFEPMHAARSRRLLQAVEALVQGRQLVLTALARHWPGASWMHAPLKALDRLLSNAHVHQAILPLQQAMALWLVRQPRPIILVDWSDLKGDKHWCVLRAAIPTKGSALTLCEQIFPQHRMGQPQAQREFLQELRRCLPAKIRPIVVTDAGFRSDWYRSVQALGWDYVGRLRNNTQVRREGEHRWQPCASLHEQARPQARDLGEYAIVKGNPLPARLVLIRRPRRGRSAPPQPTAGSSHDKKCIKRAREPWLLVTSLRTRPTSATQIVAAYAKRMQIEEAFRDLKSDHFGVGFQHSCTRRAPRLTVLLMLHTLTRFAAWLLGLAETALSLTDPLSRQRRHRHRYSQQRRSLEWLRRTVLPPELRACLNPARLQQLVVTADYS